MGLKSIIENAAATAIKTVADLTYTIEYHRVTSRGQYDSATNTYVNIVETVVTVSAVPVKERKDEDDFQLVDDDTMKIIIASKHIGFEPSIKDYLFLEGSKYEILKNVYVPGQGIYTLTIRNP